MPIADLAKQNQAFMVALRRDLHRHPELSGQEAETSRRVMRELTTLGIPFVRVGEHGIVATITGTRDDRVVALRADMDALPIQEENGHLDYASTVPGVMHACGHDGHTAMLLGAARVLLEVRDQLPGTVKLCFQQAEETGGGALEILDELKKFPVVCCFGMHLWSEFETGRISVEAGPRMAAGQGIWITVTGEGTHGAYPHRGRDAILAASAIVMNLAALVSRETDPNYPTVLTFGKIAGGEMGNVIPERVQLAGSLRTTNNARRDAFFAAIERVVHDTARTWRTTATIETNRGAPLVANDPAYAEIARRAALAITDAADVVPFNTLMASENFGEFLAVYPGVFAFVGARNEAIGAVWPHHHPKFNIDEAQLWKGAALHAQFALEALKQDR
jgi:amidohydrolase